MNVDALKADLRLDEGTRLVAYQDNAEPPVWTIGCGHTRFVCEGMTCTKEQAENWLSEDIGYAIAGLDNNAIWWRHMPEPAQRALCNMAFNLGWPRLSGFKKMLAALQRGDFLAAADEAEDSKWFGQVGARAKRIAALYRAAATVGVANV